MSSKTQEMNKNILSLQVNEMINLLTPLYLKAISDKTIPLLPTLMLWGAPGVGKSQAFKLIAKNLQRITKKVVNTIDVRLLLFNPVDLRGIPVADTNREFAKWLKPQIFNMDASDDVINILILDEISAAPQSVQAAAYQLTLDRVIGEHKLPDNCIILAAGNRVTDKSVAYKMPKALGNRMTHIEIVCNVEDWKTWAIPHGISPEIIAYIGYSESSLFDFDPNNDFNAYPTPRSWEMVDKYIKMFDGNLDVAFPLIAGSIGLGTAQAFKQFTKVFTKLPKIEDIYNGNYLVRNDNGEVIGVQEGKLPKESDVLYALSAAISTKIEKADIKQIKNILSYLMFMQAEYATITVKDMIKFQHVKQHLMETSEWVEWSRKFKSYIL